jgi:D-alanine-D-alanine ligase
MERKLRVGVIFGGRSGEHEVSIASAASVMAALDNEKYEIVPIGWPESSHASSRRAPRWRRRRV